MKRLAALLAGTLALVGLVAFSQSHSAASSASQKKASEGARGPRAEAIHLNNLGTAYMNQQEFEHGLKFFRQAETADPTLQIARINEGIALENLQQYAPAIELFNAVLKDDPSNAAAWYNLGLIYKGQGDSEKALDAFQHAQKSAPNDADVLYFVGVEQSDLGLYKDAIDSFSHAIEINPFHASAEFGMSRALQRSGAGDKAREHLAHFQHLTQTKLGSPMTLSYGDQGHLSLVVQAGEGVQPPAETIRVHFKDVTRDAGLAGSASTENARAETKNAGAESKDKDKANANTATGQSSIGSGACFFDLDNDGRPDLLLADGGPQGGVALFHNLGNGKFEDITRKAGLDPALHGIACAAGDYDNDGRTDLVLTTATRVLVFHNEGNNTLKDVTDALGIRVQNSPLGATFIDYDHDGDLDLYVGSSAAGKNTLWRNNGNSTFTDVTDATGFAGDTATYGVTGSDFNNDRAIDMIVSGSQPRVMLNPREGMWNALKTWPSVPPVVAAVTLDFDKDGWMDVVLAHDGAPAITLWHNHDGKGVDQVSLPIPGWRRAWGIAALDYDNDGWIDLAAVGETEDGRGEMRLFRNLGRQGFKDVTADVGLDAVKLSSPRALVAADFDGDGATDLLITQSHGPAVLLRNEGGKQNHFLRIALKGLNDNKSAVGAKVEVFAGALRQKWEISGSGYLSQSSTELIAGLGKEREVDVVRMLWPTGVLQDEAQLAADTTQKITEIDRRGSSCPLLFAWDGNRYRFVADMIGAGVVGHWIAPGERNIPDSTEYIKVDGDHVQTHNGRLSFRFMEPMEEVVYLDQARLLAIDHPADSDVYPNEYFASNPPFPEFKVISSRNPRPLAGAWDDHGNDVLPLLKARDRRYVSGFEILPYTGFTKQHTLELELPEVYQGGPLRLLLYGYIEYFMANSMYAASQAGIAPVAPYVEALNSSGKWVRVVDDMGFPAGLPRTTVADLSGKLPLGTKRLRITTNLQIYWDQILVDTTPNRPAGAKITELPLAGSQLVFHGYPRAIEGKSPGDLRYIYEDVSATGPYAHQTGAYTRLGDVSDLVRASDDRFVVFGSGDEVQLEFDPAGLPALPAGWKRDYFFFADGYEKDMDFYAAEGLSVAPMPFHSMSRYPYAGENYPQDDRHINYILDYNTRFLSDEASPVSYSFRYREQK